MKFRHHKHTCEPRFGSTTYTWQVVGPVGGVHFHVSIHDEGKYEPSCGLEYHHSARAGMYGDQAPHHLNCQVIGEPCWHDGTSLYANENLWPMIEGYMRRCEHKQIFRILEGEYVRRFEKAED
jgi:hypothetical protein